MDRPQMPRDGDDGVKEPVKEKERKPYRAPEVLVHGPVEEITQDMGGSVTDGILGSWPA